jgi:hypothetical protein
MLEKLIESNKKDILKNTNLHMMNIMTFIYAQMKKI